MGSSAGQSATPGLLLVLTVMAASVGGHYHPPPAEVLQLKSATLPPHTHAPTPTPPAPTNPGEIRMRGPHHPRRSSTRDKHEHYTPHREDGHSATKLTQDTQLLHDEEHIREDLGGIMSEEDTKKMTSEELEFHYFKLHDFDNNTKLDGLEILQAIQHIVHNEPSEEEEGAHPSPAHPNDNFNYYIELIDKVLAEDDLDNDGYLSYIEYVLGRQKDDHEIQHTQSH